MDVDRLRKSRAREGSWLKSFI